MSISQIIVAIGIISLVLSNDTIKGFIFNVFKFMYNKPMAGIKNIINEMENSNQLKEKVNISEDVLYEENCKSCPVDVVQNLSLANIVTKWEELRNMCKDYNLSEAENKLEEVFPLLLNDKDKDIK
jgi:hypothetical protein